jgi:hypothetical protein
MPVKHTTPCTVWEQGSGLLGYVPVVEKNVVDADSMEGVSLPRTARRGQHGHSAPFGEDGGSHPDR